MDGSLTKKEWEEIYALLDRVCPVDFDCGTLCGCACCGSAEDHSSDGEDLGIYLLPGEHLVQDRRENPEDDWLIWSEEDAQDYGFPESWQGNVYFVKCKTPPVCPREKRPFQCRTFPLKPLLDENGVLKLILYNEELPYSCPFLEKKLDVTDAFCEAVYEAWQRLLKDPRIYDLVEMDSED